MNFRVCRKRYGFSEHLNLMLRHEPPSRRHGGSAVTKMNTETVLRLLMVLGLAVLSIQNWRKRKKKWAVAEAVIAAAVLFDTLR